MYIQEHPVTFLQTCTQLKSACHFTEKNHRPMYAKIINGSGQFFLAQGHPSNLVNNNNAILFLGSYVFKQIMCHQATFT